MNVYDRFNVLIWLHRIDTFVLGGLMAGIVAASCDGREHSERQEKPFMIIIIIAELYNVAYIIVV